VFERIVAKLKAFDVSGLSRGQLCDVTRAIAKVRGALDALEVRVAAAVENLGDDGGDAESMMRAQGGMSTREARRRKQRAERLRNMPNTAEKLADGEITGEHVDALVRAADATSEALVDSDQRLLADAARRPADVAARDVRDWTTKRQRPADREERYRQQRANRSLSFFVGDDRMKLALCRSDDVTAEMLERRVEQLARRMHRQDTRTHGINAAGVRSWEQLRHDALMILAGVDNANKVPANVNRVPVDANRVPAKANHRVDTGDEAGSDRSEQAERCTCGARRGEDLTLDDLSRPVGMRSQILVVADIDAISGRDPAARIEIPGAGPIPKSVLDRLACDAEIFGLIFNGDGVCLWHGRSTRTVSPQQWRALVARDRGCVMCASHPAYCEAHHIIEWLDLGETEIENLALLCTRHHHEIHEAGLMLIRDGPDRWHTTPKPPNPTGRCNPIRYSTAA
jgi:hypothetical protein